MILGLCGGSGAGKTTLIHQLEEQFPGDIAVIDMDNYYISRGELPLEERRKILELKNFLETYDFRKFENGESYIVWNEYFAYAAALALFPSTV